MPQGGSLCEVRLREERDSFGGCSGGLLSSQKKQVTETRPVLGALGQTNMPKRQKPENSTSPNIVPTGLFL